MPKEYDDCPQVCSRSKPPIDPERFTFCDGCSRTRLRREFERETVRQWEKHLGETKAEGFRFEEVMAHLINVRTAKDRPDTENSITVGRFVQTYEMERERFENELAKNAS